MPIMHGTVLQPWQVSRGLSAPHVPLRFLFERLSLEDAWLWLARLAVAASATL